jgi:predicted permease
MISTIERWLARLRSVFAKRRLDDDFAEELAHHLAQQTEDNLRAGMTADEAARQARIALGGVDQARELHRETRGLPWLEQFGRDLNFAIRVSRRERAFTLVALAILAIGIGLNTTVFSLVNTVLLRPLPFAHAEQLVWITNGDPTASSRDLSAIASKVDTWEGLQETSRTLDRIEAYDPFSVRQTYRLTGAGDPETIVSVGVSHGLPDLLGLRPAYGRLFVAEDGLKNAPHRVVLTHQLWRRRFGADPRIVGQTVQINGTGVEVIGILPPADSFTSVFFPAVRVDVLQAMRNDDERNWGNTVFLIGRAKPGVDLPAVTADLKLAVAQLKQKYPDRERYFSANVTPLHEWVAGGLRRPLVFLWVAAGLVLAIVSFNLGGLMLARGAARRKELAVRCALGAGRWQIVGQLLTECLLLVTVGSVLGGVLAEGLVHVLAVRSGVEIPLLQGLRLDAASLGFTSLLCVVTVGLCGALPAWKLARGSELESPLSDAGRGSSESADRARLRGGLVVLEVALAAVLAISAGLVVRSFLNLMKADLGFVAENLVAIRIDLPAIPDDAAAESKVEAYLDALLNRVRALPGVLQAGITDCIPVERDRSWGLYPVVAGHPEDQRWNGAHIRIVSPGFFGAMGTTLVAGHDFARTDAKDHPGVIIINQTLAKKFWPSEDPVGRQVKVGGQMLCTVVGVATDVRHSGPEYPAGNEMYLSAYQLLDGGSWDLLVRTNLPAATLAAGLRQALREVDPSLPLTKVRPMQTLIDRTLSSRRLLVALIGGFAAIAIGLAALGLYGVISYLVTRQTREIGIRLALGADAARVRREVVGRTLRLAAAGTGLGVIGALAAGYSLRAMLVGISGFDPVTYLAAVLLLLACALLAGYLPARRASRVSPLEALRSE